MKNTISFYLKLAQVISNESRAQRLKVGAILVKDDNIIAYGYNGTPKGFDNVCEYQLDFADKTEADIKTKPEVLHAESNAIAKCARSVNSSDGAILYSTHSPCFECCKLIIQAGIQKVIYAVVFRDISGLQLLSQAGIEVELGQIELNA